MPLRAYGFVHLAWLAGIAGVAIALAMTCRSRIVRHEYVRAALICLLVGGELQRFFADTMHFPDALPLNLCNVTTWMAVLACLRLTPVAVEFVYFLGLSGAGMALTTPDMGSTWPIRFFINHGAIIFTAAALVFGGIAAPIRRGAVARAAQYLALYCLAVGLFDWRFGANYAWLCRKPGVKTLGDYLGPWPFYILSAGFVSVGLFWLLWLPIRPRTREAPSFAPQDGHGLLPE